MSSYEMQWTVRYFLYMSGKWVIHTGTGTGIGTGIGHHNDVGNTNWTWGSNKLVTGTGIGTGTGTGTFSPGAIAYHRRKHAVWEEIMNKADRTFRTCNPAYQSPL